MSDEQPPSTRKSFIKWFFGICWFVLFWSVWLPAIEGKFPNPQLTLTRDWVPDPIWQHRTGFYKYMKVLGSGDRPYLLDLNTDRGVVRNVRAALMPGSYWKNVTINSEGRVTRKELSKSRYTGCLEDAVIMRRTGIIMVGGVQVTDIDGDGFGNVDLVSCKKKNDSTSRD